MYRENGLCDSVASWRVLAQTRIIRTAKRNENHSQTRIILIPPIV